jgi:asparagine synthase (glutamine-hydrolysing)
MCEINDVIFKSKQELNLVKQTLTKMNDLIIHRGPDDDGVFTKSTSEYSIGMAMRRLAIIDLSSGQQPMFSEDKNIAIVFNGEIYNFLKLKDQMKANGVQFKTTSDTEVVLKLYEQKGTEAFKDLDGMYGLSIYDFNKNKVFIARDYFGEKPLYYTNTSSEFYWASELKSIINSLPVKPSISKTGLNLFFRLTYIPAPNTIYEGIHKLEPNHFISYDLESNAIDIDKIHADNPIEKSTLSFNDAKKEVNRRIFESVESRSISDVPLGTFLSGGVDSSVVTYCLAEMTDAKIDTFSIGFEKKSYDETDKSQVVAKLVNSNHHEFIINENDLKKHTHEILMNFDEPFADSSSLPTYLVSAKTKQNVKVALTGDGGDEVFGGYNKYYIGKINKKYTNIVPEGLHNVLNKLSVKFLHQKEDGRGMKNKLNKLLNAIDYSNNYYWDIISLGVNDNDIRTLLNPEFQETNIFDYYKTKSKISNPKSLSDFRTIDRHLSLEGDMLVKVDRTSMLNSLECRAPFLNRDLYNFTMSLPEDYLLNKWSKKHILKEAFTEVFPKDFLDKTKQGFGVPVGDWLRDGLKKELLSYIETPLLKSQTIFNISEIQLLVQNHVEAKEDNTFKVWSFFCFQKWYINTYLNS